MQRWALVVSAAVILSGGIWVGATLRPGGAQSDSAADSCQLQFRELSHEVGVRFTHFDSPRASVLPEDVGSGAGWGDYDNDGDEDLYLVNFAGPFLLDPQQLALRSGNRLLRNDGNGTFTDVTAAAGVGHVGWDYACLWFDYDNDGRLDLAVTRYDGVTLYRNRGDLTFEDVTERAGLAGINRFLLGMTAADYDRDGDLDLYLCGYVTFDREAARNRPLVAGRPAVWTNPVSYPAEANILLQNDGQGRLVDVTASAGVADAKGKSMQALFCDFNNDGWPDLYVANDVGTADALFVNQRDGTFGEVSVEAGTHDRRASMGLAVGDIWHRGWMDLFVTHWVAEDHALWKNRTDEFGERLPIAFDDVGPHTGITRIKPSAYVGWGTGLHDLDNDGHLDIMLVNGSTIEDELTLEVLSNPKLMPQPAQLLWNDGTGRMIDVSDRAGPFFAEHRVSRGLAFADYDSDGLLDAAVICHGQPAVLLHNETPRSGHWLGVRLSGTTSNRFGVGARIDVHTASRRHTQQRLLGTSYLSSDSHIAHFGLGKEAWVEAVEVHWPSGRVSRLEQPPTDQTITISEESPSP
jgi:hypothetical protein